MTVLVLLCIFLASYTLADCYEKYRIKRTETSFLPSIQSSGIIVLPFSCQGTTLNFMIDTGANCSYIVPSVLNRIKYLDCEENDTVVSALSTTETKAVQFSITYKGVEFTHKFWTLSMEESLNTIEESEGVRIDGILGTDFLRKYGCTVDFHNFRLYAV